MSRPRTRDAALPSDVRRQLIELFGTARNVHARLNLADLGFDLHHVRLALLPRAQITAPVRNAVITRWNAWRRRYLKDEHGEYFTFKLDPEALPPLGDPDHDRRLRDADRYPDPDAYL